MSVCCVSAVLLALGSYYCCAPPALPPFSLNFAFLHESNIINGCGLILIESVTS